MNRQKIEGSSNLAEAGYNGERMTLEIKFHNGSIYQYCPITRAGWEGLMKAESKGKYFIKNIRSNPDISYQEVDEMQADN